MFNISAKADYALVIMLELARFAKANARRAKNNDGYLSISEITATRKLSPAYLTQITRPLKKASLLLSKEGKTGGYMLAKSPEAISV